MQERHNAQQQVRATLLRCTPAAAYVTRRDQAYEEFQREKKMVDGIIAKIMEEERVEQMEKMKKRNESVEMMRQVRARCAVLCWLCHVDNTIT